MAPEGTSASSWASSRAQIVAALMRSPGLSRTELADRLGIGRATATEQVRRLVETGIVKELPSLRAGAGRPSVPLELVGEAGFLVGASLAPDCVHVVASSLDGRVLSSERLPFDSQVRDPAESLAHLLKSWKDGVKGAGACFSLGVALSGVLDEASGSIHVSVVMGWRNLALGATLRQVCGPNVWVANDMRAVATRAALHAPDEVGPDFLTFLLGAGVGLAVVRDGEPQAGVRGASTEFAHVSIDPAGPQCRCGNRGCVQAYMGERELAESLLANTKESVGGWHDIAALAQSSAKAASMVAQAGYALGRGVGGAVTMTGIPQTLITGEALAAWAVLSEPFHQGLRETTPTLSSPCRVTLQPWDDYKVARGVATLAFSATLASGTPLNPTQVLMGRPERSQCRA